MEFSNARSIVEQPLGLLDMTLNPLHSFANSRYLESHLRYDCHIESSPLVDESSFREAVLARLNGKVLYSRIDHKAARVIRAIKRERTSI